jgi:hypothetical protein
MYINNMKTSAVAIESIKDTKIYWASAALPQISVMIMKAKRKNPTEVTRYKGQSLFDF